MVVSVSPDFSRPCPKCHYTRVSADTAPAWQCPRCGIAYAKYAGYLERMARLRGSLAPRQAGDPVPSAAADGSLWMLVLANVLTLVVALWQAWDPLSLMLLYWAQSVIIGISNVFRILALDRFSTTGFTINDQAVDPTPATKVQTAVFFSLHYGLFHAVYAVFLLAANDAAASLDGWFGLCVVAFVVNHAWSHRYNLALDRRGTPNIGTLMFTPYLRIVPMHLTLIFAGFALDSVFGLLLFGVLKTAADCGMHLVEHQQLRKVREGGG